MTIIQLDNAFVNLIILFSSSSQITSPTFTTAIKILYRNTSSYLIEPYFLNINYTDSASDILTIGGSNSSFIGFIKNFQIFIGTSTAFISIILSKFTFNYIIALSTTSQCAPLGCQLSIGTQGSYCLTSYNNSCSVNEYYDSTMGTCRSIFLCLYFLFILINSM